MSMQDLTLSVSIVVYDLHKELLARCIQSLRESIDKSPISEWSLTLIDNGDNGQALGELTGPQITLTKNPMNVGYGIAHNQAILSTRTDFHLILNPDVLVDDLCITEAVKLLTSNEQIIMICPEGATPDGSNAHLCKRYPSVLDLLLRGFMPRFIARMFQKRLDRYEYRDLNNAEATEVELISGCFMLARTAHLQKIGGFDRAYFLYFEDFDLSLRMARTGKVVHLPAAKIVHYGGNSARKGAKHIWLFCKSAFRFYNQHGWKLI